MRRLFLLLMLALFLPALGLLTGCDEDNPVESDGIDTAEFEMALEQFGDMDEITGEMVNAMFGFVGVVFDSAAGGGRVGKTAWPIEFDLHYDDVSQYWVFSVDAYLTEAGVTFGIYDSIQFRYASGPVQWPEEDSVTAIESYQWFNIADSSDGTGFAYQNLLITTDVAGSDTVVVNGVGGFAVDASWEDVEGNDTTNCDLLWNIGVDFTDVELDLTTINESGEIGCPLSGEVEYLGRITLGCTGAYVVDLDATWTVTETFADSSITIVISSGGNQMQVTEPCS